MEFDNKKGLTLTISYIGFKKLTIDLESYDFSGEVVKREYVLTSYVNLLDEIIVKPENIEQDTISIDISKLNLADNNKLGEILKKSPNFRLDDNGSITKRIVDFHAAKCIRNLSSLVIPTDISQQVRERQI